MPEVVYPNLKPPGSQLSRNPLFSLRNEITTMSETQAPSPAAQTSGNLPGLHCSLHNVSEQMQVS